MRVIEEGGFNIEDWISEDMEKKLRYEEIESNMKRYQKQMLQMINEEEKVKAELNRRTKEKMGKDRK